MAVRFLIKQARPGWPPTTVETPKMRSIRPQGMRSIKSLPAVFATIAALTFLVPSAAASSPIGEIHVTKTCTITTVLQCTIQTSSGVIPVGTVGTYNGPLFTVRLSSEVVLVTPDGASATGHCTLSFSDAVTNFGTCTFGSGTGWLAGFHANLKVTDHLDTGVTNWDGMYHFD